MKKNKFKNKIKIILKNIMKIRKMYKNYKFKKKIYNNNQKFNIKFLKQKLMDIINYKFKLNNKITILINYNKILTN